MNSKIKQAFDRIESMRGYDDFDEKRLEFILLFDIFRQGLNYSDKTAISQERSGAKLKKTGYVDILLKPLIGNKDSWICVEIKSTTFNFNQKNNLQGAFRQIGKYIVSYGARYGILTNSKRWYFLEAVGQTKVSKNQFYVRSILQFNIQDKLKKEQKRKYYRYLEKALRRCRKETVSSFFKALSEFQKILRQNNGEIKASYAPTKLFAPISEKYPSRLNRGDENFLRGIIKDQKLQREIFDFDLFSVDLKVTTRK